MLTSPDMRKKAAKKGVTAKARATRRRPRVRPEGAQVPVEVFVGQRSAAGVQPDLFRVCPLGLQFYAARPVPQFTMMSFSMKIATPSGTSETACCTGVVVHSQAERETGLQRVWVKFLDLPDDKKARIKCIARDANLSCPHCENS